MFGVSIFKNRKVKPFLKFLEKLYGVERVNGLNFDGCMYLSCCDVILCILMFGDIMDVFNMMQVMDFRNGFTRFCYNSKMVCWCLVVKIAVFTGEMACFLPGIHEGRLYQKCEEDHSDSFRLPGDQGVANWKRGIEGQ